MLRLTRIREREDGAIAIIVAMLFFFGVMLALGALTVDVGNINADRRQLQNGADAVALAIAQECVNGGTCDSVVSTKLQNLADLNAADGYTDIKRVDGGPAICGNVTDTFTPCPDLTGTPLSNLQECPQPSNLPATVKYVRVYTETDMKKADGTHHNILPYYFGAAIAGVGSGANQQTCAQVGIGPMGSSDNALPIVVAQCAYETARDEMGFPPMPPNRTASALNPPAFPDKGGKPVAGVQGGVDYSKYVMAIYSHISGGTNGPSKCASTDTTTNPSGQYLPGGFGWTTTPDNLTCAVDFNSATGTVPVGQGADTPDGCRKLSGNSFEQFIGHTVYIPIMQDEMTDGKNYNINGFAGFYVAGYNATGVDPKSTDGYTGTGALSLSGGDDGFWGWFTNDPYIAKGSWGNSSDPTLPKVIGIIG